MERAPDLLALFAQQREAFARDPYPPLATRLARLQRLRDLVQRHGDRMAQAISADFGHRSLHETAVAETFIVLAGIAHTRKHPRMRRTVERYRSTSSRKT